MKILCSVLMVVFSLFQSHAQTIEKTYRFDLPKIANRGEFQTIYLNDCMNTALTGEPALAWYSVRLLLPPGEGATKVEFIGENKVQVLGNFKIFPQQASRPLSQPGPWHFAMNEEIYDSESVYPQNPTGIITTQYLNGYAVALTSFSPLEYIPATGELFIYQKVKIKIHTAPSEASDNALANLRSGLHIENRIECLVQNIEMIEYYSAPDRAWDDYEMLIVTPNLFKDFFDDLVQFYFKQGVRANVVTKEAINSAMTGQDSAEKLRNYIIQEYQQHGIQYVLIGGDVDHIAYRGLYCFVQSSTDHEDYNIPADLYFSALDGNWNTNGDSKWGEPGEDDLLPEISVGRLTFSSVSELNNILNKLMKYQSEPVLGEFNKALFASEDLMDDPETYGSDYLELLVGFHDDNGYDTWGIPETYNIQRLYEEIQPWGPYDLRAAINSGQQYVHHVGHANWDYVAYFTNWDIFDSNFSGANGVDHNFTIFHSHGCNCGAFDENDCIMEEMLTISNFAVAVVGNSRYGWFNEGTTEGPAVHLHREMMDALYHEKINRIGDAFVEMKIQTAPWVTAPGQWEEGALRWNFYDINILGDPAMAIWTAEPMNLDADYEEVLLISETMTDVTITWNGTPMSNITCVISVDSVIHGLGVTDSIGQVTIVIDEPFAQTGDALLSVSGNNCIPEFFPIWLTATGVEEQNHQSLVIYPNPTREFLNVNLLEKNGLIFIYNSDGQLVMQVVADAQKMILDVSTLPSGNYHLVFRNSEKNINKNFTKVH